MYHSGPLAWASLTHTLGGTIVLMRHFDAERWIDLVREHGVTNTFTAPTQLKRIVALPDEVLARADLSTMRSLVANAAPVPYSLKQEIIAKLGDGFLFEVYGSTELGVDAVLPPEDQLRKPGSCGKPYGSVQAPDRRRRRQGLRPTGEPGELFVSSTLALDGYHATDEQVTDLEGWKSVGDVAYLDDEGYLYICDRKKDMIISGGVNIYPAEIEAVLHAHPDVMDAAVFGIPSEEWGEAVHAVVQPRPGHTIDLDDARRVLRRAPRRLQAAPHLGGARRAAPDRVRQAPQAGPPRRALAGPPARSDGQWLPDPGRYFLQNDGNAGAGLGVHRPGGRRDAGGPRAVVGRAGEGPRPDPVADLVAEGRRVLASGTTDAR